MEADGEALTVTIAAGFPYADVPDAGVSSLVTTDSNPDAARRLATELAELAWSLREGMVVVYTPPSEAVTEAMAFNGKPVMLVDVGDNIGGGTPGDGTVLLRELLAQGAKDAVMVIADPEAAARAIAAGVRNTVKLSVGGNTAGSMVIPFQSKGPCVSSPMAAGCTRGRRTPVSRSKWDRAWYCAAAG